MKKHTILKILLLVLIIILCCLLFTAKGRNILQVVFSHKYYIKFDDLDKVILCYIPENSPFQRETFNNKYPILENVSRFEVEIDDKDFLKLIEDNYQNKFVNNYHEEGIRSEGIFKVIINDKISLSISPVDILHLRYNEKIISLKHNEEIYNKIIELVIDYVENLN